MILPFVFANVNSGTLQTSNGINPLANTIFQYMCVLCKQVRLQCQQELLVCFDYFYGCLLPVLVASTLSQTSASLVLVLNLQLHVYS